MKTLNGANVSLVPYEVRIIDVKADCVICKKSPSMNSPQHVLIIGKVWPEPGSSAAGSRMMQLIDLFRKSDSEVTFASSASESEYSVDLEKTGIGKAVIELNRASFDRFIKKLQPDIVIFDRFMTEEQFGWRVTEACPDAIRILDTEDLHALRAARQNAWKEGKEFKQRDLLSEEIAKREIASIYRCDLSLIISEYEMSLLSDVFQIDNSLIYYLPFLLNSMDDDDFKKLPDFKERSGFISIGNFLHEPNWNSVLWLKEEIWPLIRKSLPEAELHIYGAYPSQKVYQLHKPEECFIIKGRAESSADVMAKARVLLAPLRFGAGLKGKLVEAMQYGTPSVTTEIGAEGINGKYGWNGFIANDAESIAEKAVELHKKKSFWEESQKNGLKILKNRFDKTIFDQDLMDHLRELKQNLANYRERNFIGNMLNHHSLLSTKYMSKWIEEKNKNNVKS
jgi:O-antigen biosynthesis protein